MVIAGRTVRQFVHGASLFEPGPETEYRYFDGLSIRSVAPEGIEGLFPAGADYPELPGPLVAGLERTLIDQSESEDIDGDGRPDTRRGSASSSGSTRTPSTRPRSTSSPRS